jgi:Protein of unknown function (DUF2934)
MARPQKKVQSAPELVAPQDSGDTTAANVDRDRIAARAYELYMERGGGDGRALDDWLSAEHELCGPSSRHHQA